MWPLAELDHGLVEVIFSANGSRTSLLSARVRRQAHYSSILPLQASGIICHNWVWHDHTTECIKILLAAQASSLAPACLQAAAVMDTSEVLTCCTKDTQCQWPKQVLLSPGLEPSSWQWVNNAELEQGGQLGTDAPPRVLSVLEAPALSHQCLETLLSHQSSKSVICRLSCGDKNKTFAWKFKLVAKSNQGYGMVRVKCVTGMEHGA